MQLKRALGKILQNCIELLTSELSNLKGLNNPDALQRTLQLQYMGC
jgi:hypothetical protein